MKNLLLLLINFCILSQVAYTQEVYVKENNIYYSVEGKEVNEDFAYSAFRVKEPFFFYLKSSTASEIVRKAEKGEYLEFLRIKDDGWYLVREGRPFYRELWIKGSSLVIGDKLVPVCSQ